jgi:hypothetical protein
MRDTPKKVKNSVPNVEFVELKYMSRYNPNPMKRMVKRA